MMRHNLYPKSDYDGNIWYEYRFGQFPTAQTYTHTIFIHRDVSGNRVRGVAEQNPTLHKGE
jgi:hypothetical protein